MSRKTRGQHSWFIGQCDIIASVRTREKRVKDPLRHLPFALVAFIVLLIGFVDLAVHVEWNTLVTLLAPILWLGLYFAIGTDRATETK